MSAQTNADRVFDSLDVEVNGYLTPDQIKKYHCEQHMCDLSLRQVDAAAQKACGTNKVRRDKFLAVMRGVSRRCRASQSLRWDFEFLDTSRRGAIPVEKAQFLFKAVRNQLYSTAEFQEFMKARPLAGAGVAFEELEVVLSEVPDARFTADIELDDAQQAALRDLRQERQQQQRQQHQRQRQQLLHQLSVQQQQQLQAKDDVFSDDDDGPDVPDA
eukprot:EC726734.1.p1 GENE.EC726734.1~~EC726734.1.p1  ORF type:complete len:215 (+),score=44.60 EC726734.1:84-728(+)